MKRESSSPPYEDTKPAECLEEVKPHVIKKAKVGKDYASGGKQALAELIIELGLKAFPNPNEISKKVGNLGTGVVEAHRRRASHRPK